MLEPFGPPAAAFNAGIVASTLANIHRAKDAPPHAVEAFMPQIARPPEPKAVQKRRGADALSRRLRAAFGGGR